MQALTPDHPIERAMATSFKICLLWPLASLALILTASLFGKQLGQPGSWAQWLYFTLVAAGVCITLGFLLKVVVVSILSMFQKRLWFQGAISLLIIGVILLTVFPLGLLLALGPLAY
ncbi:MAG TPA: hypothetical protein VGE29_04495 [Prosthecobacter sp.]